MKYKFDFLLLEFKDIEEKDEWWDSLISIVR